MPIAPQPHIWVVDPILSIRVVHSGRAMLRRPLGLSQAALARPSHCGHTLWAHIEGITHNAEVEETIFFEFFEFLLKMRTYDLIQPKSNGLDRNLIIRATRGAHPMAVRTRRSAKMSTLFGSGQMRK